MIRNALLLLASFAMVAFQMQLSAVEAKHHDIQSLVEEARKGGDVLERLTKAAGGDMEKLTPYLTDNSPDVRATVGWAIARIATASKAKITNERVVDALIAAEETYPGYYSKLFSKIEPAVVSDEHASRLAGLVERESSSAFILAIGDLGIRQAEEALKRLAEISVTPGPAPSVEKGAERLLREKARLALAKLGHDEYLPEILGGLDPSNDHITRIEALKALGYLGRPDTAKRILELVDEPGAFEIKKSASDLVSTGIGGWALYTLQQVVSDPPTHGVDPSSFGKKDAALWKQWWQEKTTQIPRQRASGALAATTTAPFRCIAPALTPTPAVVTPPTSAPFSKWPFVIAALALTVAGAALLFRRK